MKFSHFYKLKNVNFDFINRSCFEELRDYAFNSKDRKNINMYLLMSEEDLELKGFYKKFPHLI